MKLSIITTILLLSSLVESNIDWTSACPHVKNQGQCGSSYAFAAVGALECAIARRTGRQMLLSEQEVIDCSRPYGNYGCDGGFPTSVFRYIQANGGINMGAQYPYEGVVRQCRHNRNAQKAGLARYAEVQRGSESALQQALAQVGPIAAFIDASQRSFMMYSRGIYDDPACSRQLNHAVLIVGMGQENGITYYKVKNSWGTGWGEGGYFRIAANKNRCGIADMASYPIV